MCLSRKKTWLLYSILLFIALLAYAIAPEFANAVFTSLLTLCIICGTIAFAIISCKCPQKLSPPTVAEIELNDNNNDNNNNQTNDMRVLQINPSSNERATTSPSEEKKLKNYEISDNQKSESLIIQHSIGNNNLVQKPRVYFLDNLKSFLTIFVVIHHVTLSYIGFAWYYMLGKYYNPYQILFHSILYLNQTYFMCLFFFISAYFTPSSYDKKGINKFIYDKLKRLGIPYLLYYFILGPLITGFTVNVSHNTIIYVPNPGPCWFLGWLLIFNTCYIIINKNDPIYIMKLPSLIKILLIGIIVGVIQLIINFLGFQTFIYMPIAPGSLPFYIIFFTAGIIAKRNEWLNKLISMNVNIIRILTILCTLIVIIVYIFLYKADLGYIIPKSTELDTECDPDDWNNVPYEISIFWIGSILFGGICCMVFSFFMLQSTNIFCNHTNSFLSFLSKCAYTVYLIHPIVVVFFTWSYQKILDYDFYFCDDSAVSKTHFKNNDLVLLGWIYTLCLSLIVVFPLSWCVRQLPGLNKIL